MERIAVSPDGYGASADCSGLRRSGGNGRILRHARYCQAHDALGDMATHLLGDRSGCGGRDGVPARYGHGGNRPRGRRLCTHLNRNDPLMATRSGCGSSSVFVRKMVTDSGHASNQREAQTRPIGAQGGRHQRSRTDGNPVGAMRVGQAGKRDAHGLRRGVTKRPVLPIWLS